MSLDKDNQILREDLKKKLVANLEKIDALKAINAKLRSKLKALE